VSDAIDQVKKLLLALFGPSADGPLVGDNREGARLLPAEQHAPLGERIREVLDRLAAAEGDRDALRTRAEAAEARMEVMSGLLVDLRDYVARSDGIAGYHLSGDLAPWDETGLTVEAIDVAVAADAARPHLTRAFAAEVERDVLRAENALLKESLVRLEEQPKQPATLTPRQAQIIRDLFYKNCEDFLSAVEWAGFKDPSEAEDAFDALEDIAGCGGT
jgi:hypothetical protein